MKTIKNILNRLFAFGIWAANDTLVGTHPDGVINCVAGGTIARNSLVSFSNGKVIACAAKARPLGIAQDTVNADEGVAIKLLGSATGTVVGIASETIAQGDALYEAANGKVGKTSNGYFIGYALDSAVADGEVEIQHCVASPVA